MNRIIVLGSAGAGKSTLARQLGERLRLPVYHLDSLYWRGNWEATPSEQWTPQHDALCAQPRWVIEGNYRSTLTARLQHCDAIILFNLSRVTCLAGIVRRWWRYRGRARPEMPAGCAEQIDWEFVRWVWNFPNDDYPQLHAAVAHLPAEKRLVILNSRAEVGRLLDSLPTSDLQPSNT